MGTKILIYAWIGLTVAIVAITLGFIFYRLWKKFSSYFNKQAQIIKEHKELKNMKTELEQQKGEFITSSEYGSFQNPEPKVFQQQDGKRSEQTDLSKTHEALVEESESVVSECIKDADDNERFQEKERKRFDTMILEAELLKNDGKVEEYEKKLIEAMTIDDSSLKVLKPLADLYFTLGIYKKALPLLKNISEQDPTDHKVIWQIAEIYFVTGDIQTSELLVEKAIDLKNDNPKYYLTMVEIYYNSQRLSEALAYMEKVVKLRPTNAKYLLTTAELYEEVGDLDNAKKYYFNVLEYEQNNEKAKAKIKELTGGNVKFILEKNMSYLLKEVVIRTDNSSEGIKKIEKLWQDVSNGELPILYDSDHNFQSQIFPISKYSNYARDDEEEYDFSIVGVRSDFFEKLELLVNQKKYVTYDVVAEEGELGACAKKAWEQVRKDQHKKRICRAFDCDYEVLVPSEYSQDNKMHCYLYIAVI